MKGFIMFSMSEKKHIAEEIEKILLGLNHPEMPKERPVFSLHVDGKESYSWADIKPNWTYGGNNAPTTTHFNENSRIFHKIIGKE
jgi:hypothetical protein